MARNSFKVIMNFIADNPASIVTLGGILFVVIGWIGSIIIPSNGYNSEVFVLGVILIPTGVAVHVIWLLTRTNRRGY